MAENCSNDTPSRTGENVGADTLLVVARTLQTFSTKKLFSVSVLRDEQAEVGPYVLGRAACRQNPRVLMDGCARIQPSRPTKSCTCLLTTCWVKSLISKVCTILVCIGDLRRITVERSAHLNCLCLNVDCNWFQAALPDWAKKSQLGYFWYPLAP